MALLVGDWVEPVVKHTTRVVTLNNKQNIMSGLAAIEPGQIFMVYGSTPALEDVELIPMDQATGNTKDQLTKYSVDPRLLRKIEGERLRMLQKLYHDPKEFSNRGNS